MTSLRRSRTRIRTPACNLESGPKERHVAGHGCDERIDDVEACPFSNPAASCQDSGTVPATEHVG